MTTPGRIPELDAVRGLAAVGVVLFHAFPHLFFWGWSCVDLFFVLSGYLITSICLDRCQEANFLRSFYLRRICRIWPVYFMTLLVVTFLNALSPNGFPIDTWHWHALFLQNTSQYFNLETPPFIRSFAPSWSVAIEEQFYLVWPLLILAFGRSSVPFLATALLAAGAFGRHCYPGVINLLFTRSDGLAWGCFLAWWLWRSRDSATTAGEALRIRLLQAVGIIGAAFVITYVFTHLGNPHPQWQLLAFSGFAMLFFFIIGVSVEYSGSRWLRPLRNPVLRWFGLISYGLYMFHTPIFHFAPVIASKLWTTSPLIHQFITWSCIVLLPAASWYLVERPILSLKFGSKAT